MGCHEHPEPLEATRRRLANFRARKKSQGLVEIRALVPASVVAELELAALSLPDGAKESAIRLALEGYVEKHAQEAKQVRLLISKYWSQVMEYKARVPTPLRGNAPVRIKERWYTPDEATKLLEIRTLIEGFFKARGVPHPYEAACGVFNRLSVAK